MLSKKDRGILLQIVVRCEKICFKTNNVEKEVFDNDVDLQEIICFNLFQIGELVNNLSGEFLLQYNDIPWRLIKGMRNRIVHGYDTIDLDIVWNTIKENVKHLLVYCKEIIKS